MTPRKVRIVYFPHEAKYSIWDDKYNLIKEWFGSYEIAARWLKDNIPSHVFYKTF